MRIAIICLPLLVLAACGTPPAAHQPPPPQVGVAMPLARELPVVRELSGRIEATQTVELSPQVSGKIARVLVADGAEVQVGDAIVEIDPEQFAAALARAEANVAQAEAQLRLATDARERNAKLFKENVVAQQVFDDSVSSAAAAEAALAAARAALTSAKLDLSYAVVRAPIAGKLGRIMTTAGNLVQGGGAMPPSVITTLVSVDPVEAVFDLDEVTWRHLAPRVASGERIAIRVGLAGEEGFPHAGQLTFANNAIDSASGSIRLRAAMPNPERLLTSGAYARIAIEVEAPRPVLLVHEQAILAQLATRYVLTVDDKGITAFRPVQPGPAHGPLREVSGLGPEDRIAVTNLAKVFFPGMPVSPTPVAMDTLQAQAEQGQGEQPAAGKP
jgi:membrane fusion protein, multidrug efflux system